MDNSSQPVSAIDPDDIVWLVQELLGGQWQTVEQADDEDDANARLGHYENTQSGEFRVYRSDWLFGG